MRLVFSPSVTKVRRYPELSGQLLQAHREPLPTGSDPDVHSS